jgi:hypothetical protein
MQAVIEAPSVNEEVEVKKPEGPDLKSLLDNYLRENFPIERGFIRSCRIQQTNCFRVNWFQKTGTGVTESSDIVRSEFARVTNTPDGFVCAFDTKEVRKSRIRF